MIVQQEAPDVIELLLPQKWRTLVESNTQEVDTLVDLGLLEPGGFRENLNQVRQLSGNHRGFYLGTQGTQLSTSTLYFSVRTM